MTTVVALIPVTRVCDLDLRVWPRRVFEPLGLRSSPDTGWEAMSSPGAAPPKLEDLPAAPPCACHG